MHAPTKDYMTKQEILTGAAISGVINAVINGGIQAWLLSGEDKIAMSVDSIGSGDHTVFSAAVPLAVSLAMILTAVAYTTIKVPKKPFIPTTLWLVVKHGIFTFGAIVTLAILWQNFAGTVEVGFMTAVVLLGLVAGIVSAIVNYMSISALVEDVR